MPFEFSSPDNLDQALELHAEGASWFAGGTDIVPEFKAGLANPTRLVNLKRIGDLRGIRSIDGELRLGALTTLAEIADDPRVQRDYRALAQACDLSASPQIRNVASIGGNLCQDSRCPYYRGEFHCYLKGEERCYMLNGENRAAAVTGYHECVHTHPSDPANALLAFDAQLVLRGRSGDRMVAAGDFFKAPHGDDRRMNILEPDQMIREIRLPRSQDGARSVFLKAMERATFTFALVSTAIRLDIAGERISDARVVLGGVAPVPWRELRVEQELRGSVLRDEIIERAGANALLTASPLAHNRYKLRLARAMVKRALVELSQSATGGA